MTSPVSAIEAIEKAMEGVTPGPWLVGPNGPTWTMSGEGGCRGRLAASIVLPDAPHRPMFRIAAREDDNLPAVLANTSYIAACSPDRMREVLVLARQAEALQRENAEFARAVLEVLNAVRDYLPPDGISAKDCLSRVIGAVDNSDINPLIKKLERANVDA